jgi:hypothetical protein
MSFNYYLRTCLQKFETSQTGTLHLFRVKHLWWWWAAAKGRSSCTLDSQSSAIRSDKKNFKRKIKVGEGAAFIYFRKPPSSGIR